MKCKYCNKETNLFFCPECGKVIEYPDFIRGNIKQENDLREYVDKLVKDAKSKKIQIAELVDKGVLSDVLYRIYFERVALLQSVCGQKELNHYFEKNGNSSFNAFGKLADLCMTNECQIAILGTVKAGKSMFINALLGREVASSYPTPETSALTKFRYSPKDYVKISFYSAKEWEELWKSVMESKEKSFRNDKEDFMSEYKAKHADLLKDKMIDRKDEKFEPKDFNDLKNIVARYTSAQYAEHFFAKEVEIGLSEFNVPKNVVFVDTPGLNDPVKFRSDVTKKYIVSANVILLCISAEKATIDAKELKQLATIFSTLRYARERLYVLGTKFDMPAEDFVSFWNEHTKPEFTKILSAEYLYGDKETCDRKLSPVSAWYYNLVQNYKVDEHKWNDEHYLMTIDVMTSKCLGYTRKTASVNKHGGEIKGLRGCLEESIPIIKEKSNIPYVVGTIKDGPIKDAEEIINNDIKELYSDIITNVLSVCDDRVRIIKELMSKNDAKEIKEKIDAIDKKLKDKERTFQANVESINKLTATLKEQTERVINELKYK